jgi:hypothetical protein
VLIKNKIKVFSLTSDVRRVTCKMQDNKYQKTKKKMLLDHLRPHVDAMGEKCVNNAIIYILVSSSLRSNSDDGSDELISHFQVPTTPTKDLDP